MALTHTAKEALWIQEFLYDVSYPLIFPTMILGDNQGALALAVNLTFHACMKHIWVHQHFIRECVNKGSVELKYVLTANQVADVLTKGLQAIKHEKFIKLMGLVSVNAH